MSRKIYTVPSGIPFLKALAQGLLERHPTSVDPFALAAVTVFLPTRRAIRGLEEAFLGLQAASGSGALLMPKMRALADVDEEEILLSTDEVTELDIPPAVPGLHRRLRLAELLRHRGDNSFGEALSWSKSLARFLDEALIEEIDLAGLDALIPDTLAAHYQESRAFVSLLLDHWKAILSEDGFIEAADRRARLMAAEAENWQRAPERHIYVAGSTGSIPATARLMSAALQLENGVLILPGLDRTLDEEAWREVDETHPQYGLKQLLKRLNVSRGDVADWSYTKGFATLPDARVRLLAEVLRPAPTTDSWARSLGGISLESALSGLKLQIAQDQTEEARVIALAMRECLESPGKSAALVTPDRRLARRVSAELRRWDIEVNDSAGIPLAQTPAAILLRLILQVVEAEMAPVALLSLLKHSLTRFGYDEHVLARVRSDFERLALRGPRPAPGLAGLRDRLDERRRDFAEHQASSERENAEEDKKNHDQRLVYAEGLIGQLESVLQPLQEQQKRGSASALDWAVALALSVERVAGGTEIWRTEEGEAAANLLRELSTLPAEEMSLSEFVQILDTACEGRALRPRAGLHPRLFIWGPLEARLQSADLIILGGLNEGIWPAHAEVDPWANRPMRKALQMSVPERRIGLAAHDFQELASAPNVLLTASKKIDGSPALLSRWLMRLENFLIGRKAHGHLKAQPWQSWAQALDAPRWFLPLGRPKPTPPVPLRPARFSITEIKTLRRDPYSIYAKHVLKLRPLDPVDSDMVPQMRGTLFHRILEEFGRAHPDMLPPAAYDTFIALAETRLDERGLEPEVKELWRARLKRAAKAFVRWESPERARARIASVEARGEITFDLPGTPIKLVGRVDRIDQDRASGLLTIIDYKTGAPPSGPQVKAMLDPQLPLGALLAQRGAVDGLAAAQSDLLLYLSVGGGSGAIESRRFDEDVGDLVNRSEAGLIALLKRFANPTHPYHSWAIPQYTDDKGDYDLLARVDEWRVEAGEEE